MPLAKHVRRVLYFLRRERMSADLAEEMRLHVELRERRERDARFAPDEAALSTPPPPPPTPPPPAVAELRLEPLTQVGFGVAVGATLIALGAMALSRTEQFASAPSGLSVSQGALLVAYAAFMLGVCLLACVVPTRRALGVEPIVAMRVE